MNSAQPQSPPPIGGITPHIASRTRDQDMVNGLTFTPVQIVRALSFLSVYP